MSAITIDNDLVHYEVLGRGRPVILVHGWLGSWRYWVPAMRQLSMKYRTYALDLWGFGDSGKDPARYSFEAQVALLSLFMEKLGIGKAALVGHDLGASVVSNYAMRFPDRVPRLMTVCAPLFHMAPSGQPLTNNEPSPALPASLTTTPPASAPAADTPAAAAPVTTTPPAKAPDNLPAPTPNSEAIQTEAETMPWRTEEMRARMQAEMLRQSQQLPAVGKPPREAATPPTDQPVTDLSNAAKPTLPDPLPDIPKMPKLDYVPTAADIQIQQKNPLREHLNDVVDPLALLEKHVETGPDQEKLKVEVNKTDKQALVQSIEAFSRIDTLRDLRTLSMPTLAVYGSADTLLPEPDADMIAGLKARAAFQLIAMNAHHFPMLENIAQFTRLIMDFLEIPDVTKLTIKETWERRVR